MPARFEGQMMQATSLIGPPRRSYQPLNPDGQEIRLIQIVPGTTRGQSSRHCAISCFTETVTFDKDVDLLHPYRALSYTWGDATHLVSILLDGQTFCVTENLAVALGHLAKSHPACRFWIDAICIDQASESEKSKQVAIMGAIFKRAMEVIVWIGPSEEGSAEAMNVLTQIGEACQDVLQANGHGSLRTGIANDEIAENNNERTVLSAIGCKWFPENVPAFNPIYISRIFQRPWFRRVWVLQEARVNAKVTFHCGDEKISKITLWAGGRAVIATMNNVFNQNRSWVADDPLWQTLSGANFISRRTLDLVQSNEGDLILEELLLETSTNLGHWSYEASDPRDRVYAILGLSSDLSTLGLDSDYEKPCRVVYTTAAETIITKSGTIDILYAVTWPKNVQSMPHWVPDWSISIPASFGLRQMGRFSASGKASRATPIFTSDRYGNRILTVRGYEVGKVKTILSWRHYESRGSDDSVLETAVRETVDLFHELAFLETEAYTSSSSRDEALWRTPIADCDAVFNIKRRYRPAATARMRESYNALMTLSSREACCDLRVRTYLHVMKLVSARRRLFVTDQGYIGLGADELRKGDRICLLLGGDSPLILRDTALSYQKLVGEAYVHGIMHGEFLSTRPRLLDFKLC
ncbi:hypothetical protein E8E14_006012 [Neopestalotiopsis sp. 37M]|nr:hypothetical protein E8E14_006012 [Neopestalotiopsis sp. 37M]